MIIMVHQYIWNLADLRNEIEGIHGSRFATLMALISLSCATDKVVPQ
jgi:hypothetical protein